MWNYPAAIGEAAAGVFFWPAWALYDSIKGDKFKHINFSHNSPSPITFFWPRGCPSKRPLNMPGTIYHVRFKCLISRDTGDVKWHFACPSSALIGRWDSQPAVMT